MSRPHGSRNALIRVTYDTIAEMAGGITGNTAQRYSQRGQFDPRDLGSVLSWVNERRQRQGLPLVGLPDNEVVSDDAEANDTPVESVPPDPWSQFLSGAPVYVPTLARHVSIYDIP